MNIDNDYQDECKMCKIKGELVRGKKRENIYEIRKNKPLLVIDEVLCDKHYKRLENYAKKFNWRKIR